MGRLGLELSNTTWLSNAEEPKKPEVSFRDIPMKVAVEEKEDSIADKIMAYSAYYTMVFVASCVFLPVQTSFVFAATANVFSNKALHSQYEKSQPAENVSDLIVFKSSKWDLRGSK